MSGTTIHKTSAICLSILILFLIFSNQLYAKIGTGRFENHEPYCGKTPPTSAQMRYYYKLKRQIAQYADSKRYGFLKYDNCGTSDPLGLSMSDLSNQVFDDKGLSPVCTHAALSHNGGVGAYGSCHGGKPCLSKRYHRLVHNSITQAARCFKTDPQFLFSLFLTESWLQINVSPSADETAQGISQLMKPAIDDLHIPYKDTLLEEDIQKTYIKRYLRHFQSKTSAPSCLELISRLQRMPLKGTANSCNLSSDKNSRSCNNCQELEVENQLAQDIFYAISYRNKFIEENLEQMRENSQLFEDDYTSFFASLSEEALNALPSPPPKNCETRETTQLKKQCRQTSTEVLKSFLGSVESEVDAAVNYLTHILDVEKITLEDSRMDRILATSFPQEDSEYNRKRKEETLSTYTKYPQRTEVLDLLKNPYIIEYCDLPKTPTHSDLMQIGGENPKARAKAKAEFLIKQMSSFIDKIRACRSPDLAYLDIFDSLSDNNKRILNEVSLYGHNGGGPTAEFAFADYIINSKKVDITNLPFEQFSGKGESSFGEHLVELEKEHTQMTNFIFNNSKVTAPGMMSSTTANSDVIRRKISRQLAELKSAPLNHASVTNEEHKLKQEMLHEQIKQLEELNTDQGYAENCSYYFTPRGQQ